MYKTEDQMAIDQQVDLIDHYLGTTNEELWDIKEDEQKWDKAQCPIEARYGSDELWEEGRRRAQELRVDMGA